MNNPIIFYQIVNVLIHLNKKGISIGKALSKVEISASTYSKFKGLRDTTDWELISYLSSNFIEELKDNLSIDDTKFDVHLYKIIEILLYLNEKETAIAKSIVSSAIHSGRVGYTDGILSQMTNEDIFVSLQDLTI